MSMDNVSQEKYVDQLVSNIGINPSTGLLNPVVSSSDLGLVSVKDHGALGDGTTDDTTAINAAIAALTAGSILHFPAGTYKTTGVTLTSKTDFTVQGSYATINCTTETNPVLKLDGCSRFAVRGVRVKHATQSARNDFGYGVLVQNCTDGLVEGNIATLTCSVGIYVATNSARIAVQGNAITDPLADGIHVTGGCTDITILGNRTNNTGDDGIAVVSYVADTNQVARVTVTGNTIRDSKSRGLVNAGGLDVTFSGNTVGRTSSSGVLVVEDTASAARVPDRTIITANTITDAGTLAPQVANGYGVEVGAGALATKVTANTIKTPRTRGISVVSSQCIVAHNHVLNTPSEGIQASSGFTELSVLGNYVKNAGLAGIALDGATGGDRVSVAGNTVIDCNTTSTANVDGVNIGQCSDVLVTGNIVHDSAARTQNALDLWSNTGLVVRDNVVTGVTSIGNSANTFATPTDLPEAVSAPTLTNGWVAYSAGFAEPGYYKDSGGRVYLRGLIKLGTIGAAAFTLPAGYRPPANLAFPTISNDALGRATVNADGTVVPTVGSNTWFSLDEINFRAS